MLSEGLAAALSSGMARSEVGLSLHPPQCPASPSMPCIPLNALCPPQCPVSSSMPCIPQCPVSPSMPWPQIYVSNSPQGGSPH